MKICYCCHIPSLSKERYIHTKTYESLVKSRKGFTYKIYIRTVKEKSPIKNLTHVWCSTGLIYPLTKRENASLGGGGGRGGSYTWLMGRDSITASRCWWQRCLWPLIGVNKGVGAGRLSPSTSAERNLVSLSWALLPELASQRSRTCMHTHQGSHPGWGPTCST